MIMLKKGALIARSLCNLLNDIKAEILSVSFDVCRRLAVCYCSVSRRPVRVSIKPPRSMRLVEWELR
jgi:hypothetical protein